MFKSKFLSRILILCLSIMLVLPLNISVYATDGEVQADSNKEIDSEEIVKPQFKVLDNLKKNSEKAGGTEKKLDPEEIVKPTIEKIDDLGKRTEKIEKTKHKLSKKIKLMKDSKDDSSKLSLATADQTEKTVYTAVYTPDATTNYYSGTITTEGESAYIYPIYVEPNNALQIQLYCPMSDQLDYDLYLYEFDMTTGDLITTPIDYSTYGTYLNNGITLSENVGTKNTTSGNKAYLVEVYAKQGASINDKFYVAVSTNSTYDSFETDENALHAYPVTVAVGGSSIVSRCLNSPIDNDWYYIDVPSDRNYDTMTFTLDSVSLGKGYDVEVYYATTGNKMVLVPKSEVGNVSLTTGRYYFHVYTTDTYAAGTNYTLTMKPVLRAEKIVITGYDSENGPNDYPSYAYGRGYRIDGDYFVVKGVVATSDNYAVANTQVQVEWENPYWSESSGNRYRSGTAYTDENGEFTVTLSMPPSTGSISETLSGAITFRHYYDICGVGVFVVDNPSVNDIDDLLYHFAYSIYIG